MLDGRTQSDRWKETYYKRYRFDPIVAFCRGQINGLKPQLVNTDTACAFFGSVVWWIGLYKVGLLVCKHPAHGLTLYKQCHGAVLGGYTGPGAEWQL
jgi:hypothetical protein